MATRSRMNVQEQSASDDRRWVIVGTSGSPKLVGESAEVRDLMDQGRITADSCVYEVTAAPRRLRDVPELRYLVAELLSSEPPVRQTHWSSERADFSEELAILDRPLDDEVEYLDERPPSRGRGIKLLLMVMAVAGVGFGAFSARAEGSLFQRVGSWIGRPAGAMSASRHM